MKYLYFLNLFNQHRIKVFYSMNSGIKNYCCKPYNFLTIFIYLCSHQF